MLTCSRKTPASVWQFFPSTEQDSEQLAYVVGNFKKKQRNFFFLLFRVSLQ